MRTKACIHQLVIQTRGFRLRIALGLLAGIGTICMSLCFIAVSKHLVDLVTGRQEGHLTLFIIIMLGCLILQLGLSSIESRIGSFNTVNMKNNIRHKLFAQLMNRSQHGKMTFHTGDLVNRIETDTSTIVQTLCVAFPNAIITLFQFTTAFVYLLLLDPHLAWILLLVIPLALLCSQFYVKRMRKLTRRIRTLDSRIQSCVQEHLQHRTLLCSLERVNLSTDKLTALQTKLKEKSGRRIDFSLLSRTTIQFAFAIGYFITFLWGIFGLKDKTITFGTMTAFLQLVSHIQRPMLEFSRQIPLFVQTLTSVERVQELNDLPQETLSPPTLTGSSIGLRIENLEFSYPDAPSKVLNGISHDFRPGTITAIVGETGIGKSTLIHLILALFVPDKGTIKLYTESQQVDVSPSTRCHMTYVPQGNTLMSGTIRSNLLLGNPNATTADMEAALRMAVADFVFDLPNGIDTSCSESGHGLSEGQAQRIAIARGLLRDGNLLLLDEPSSSLDSETEQQLIKNLTAGLTNKTVIIVTHKETVAEECDVVLRMT